MDAQHGGAGSLIRKFEMNELIRVIGATLLGLGLDLSVATLESESLVELNSDPARQLREHILSGDWPASLQILGEIVTLDADASLEVKSAWFAILKQQSLELLQAENYEGAFLSLQAMYRLNLNTEEVDEMAQGLAFGPSSVQVPPARADLLPQLEKLLPQGVFVENRLVELVEQAIAAQTERCTYHNSVPQKTSLFRDHKCGADQLPSGIVQTVQAHDGAICHIRFSKHGDFLASCDQCDVIVWQVNQGQLTQTQLLSLDNGAIAHFCWHPQELRYLLTCGEGGARVWNAESGVCMISITKDDVSMLSCVWANGKNGVPVIFTGNDDSSISEWALRNAYEKRNWGDKNIMKSDLALSVNKEIVFSSDTSTITLFNPDSLEEKRVEENSILVSLALSSDLKNLLVSLSNNTVSLWNIEDNPKQIKFFDAPDIVDFNKSVCFGGVNDAFIAGGNMDSKVRIWHRCSGDLVCTLVGHGGPVHSVCWSPTHPTMLVSGGADGVMLVWGTEADGAVESAVASAVESEVASAVESEVASAVESAVASATLILM